MGGGVATIRQYLQAGLIDEMHLAIAPVLLGQGEDLFAVIDAKTLGYRCTEQVATTKTTHIVISRGGVASLCFGRGSLAADRGGEVRGASCLGRVDPLAPGPRTSEPSARTGEVAEASGERDPQGF